MSACGTSLTWIDVCLMVATGGQADMVRTSQNDAIDPNRTSISDACCSSETGFSL